ncbi:hypothetical protein VTP01DRAFT_9178 [Rhizomucor pusillus]|uniref:uncharacterized protein n=1 Tax=Rhizomucor pusillus TaxID=4840 RepID=UPI0037420315
MALSQRFFNEALREFNRAFSLLEQPLGAQASRSLLGAVMRHPPTDITETADAYELHAELPGVEKKDINIQVTDGNVLTLSGNIDRTTKSSSSSTPSDGNETTSVVQGANGDKQASWWTSERVTGAFSRSFSFPSSIDKDAIKATYKDGILSIKVPKAQSSATQITIE